MIKKLFLISLVIAGYFYFVSLEEDNFVYCQLKTAHEKFLNFLDDLELEVHVNSFNHGHDDDR